MDLTQRKLTRSEWETIETPVSPQEKQILTMLVGGYKNVNIRTNENESMYSFIKIEQTAETDYMLFKKYFEESIKSMITKYGKGTPLENKKIDHGGGELKTLKSADMIRIQNLESKIGENKKFIFEFLLI